MLAAQEETSELTPSSMIEQRDHAQQEQAVATESHDLKKPAIICFLNT
jgi:hypothetical protein